MQTKDSHTVLYFYFGAGFFEERDLAGSMTVPDALALPGCLDLAAVDAFRWPGWFDLDDLSLRGRPGWRDLATLDLAGMGVPEHSGCFDLKGNEPQSLAYRCCLQCALWNGRQLQIFTFRL